MQPFFQPVNVGRRSFDPTFALIVGPLSCYCVCATPDNEVEVQLTAAEAVLDEARIPTESKVLRERKAEAVLDEAHLPAELTLLRESKAVLDEEPASLEPKALSQHKVLGVASRRRASAPSCEDPVGARRSERPARPRRWSEVSDGGQPQVARSVSEGWRPKRGTLISTITRLPSIARAVLFTKFVGDRRDKAEQFETRLLEYLQESRPPSIDRLAELGWEDHCTRSYELYLKWLSGPPRVMLSVQTQTERMVQSLPAVQLEGDRICGGLFPILCTVGSFPQWLRIVQSATLLKQLSPLRRIWHCSVSIGLFSCDFIVFVAVVNRLTSAGCVDIVLKSPEPDSEGQEWLGITVPPRSSCPRMSLNAYGMSYTPISRDHGRVEAQMELNDNFPLRTLAIWLIKACNDKFLPQMEKVNRKFNGSAIEEILNAQTREATETRRALVELGHSVDAYLACQEGLRTGPTTT